MCYLNTFYVLGTDMSPFKCIISLMPHQPPRTDFTTQQGGVELKVKRPAQGDGAAECKALAPTTSWRPTLHHN